MRATLLAIALLMTGCASAQSVSALEGNMMVYEYCDDGLKAVHYLNTAVGDEVFDSQAGLRFRHAGETRYYEVSWNECSIRWSQD